MSSSNDNPPPEDLLGYRARSPDNLVWSIKKRAITMKRFLPYSDLRSVAGLALFVIAAVSFWQAVYTVPSDSVAVVQRFGKFHLEIQPGLHFKLPLGIDIATIVPVKRQLKQEFGFATPGANDPYQRSSEHDGELETQMVTGDLNAALVEWVVQYRIADPIKSLRGVYLPKAFKLTPEIQ